MQQFSVHPLLAEIIARACLTESDSIQNYSVLPGIYTVIGFQFSGRIYHVEENRPLHSMGVTGILESGRVFRSDASTRSLLIFLKPGGFYRIFGSVASAVKSQSLALADVTSTDVRRAFADILMAPGTILEKWNRLQERFLKLVHRDLSPESRAALYYIHASYGLPRVAGIAKNLGVSTRTLERKFSAEVGTSPKHLARILRWQNTLRHLENYPDFGTAALANGYFDQAHFIRETQNLSGMSPKKIKLSDF